MKKSLELLFGEAFEFYFIAVRTAANELEFPQNAFYSPPVRLWNSISSYYVPASRYWRQNKASGFVDIDEQTV